jgi:hypothetical protein
MKPPPQQYWRQLRALALTQAILGFVLLLLTASALVWYIDIPQRRLRAEGVAAGLLLCGITALVSSWALYRGRPFATPFYAASWSLNVLGWIALGFLSSYRPIWWVLATAACLVTYAGVATFRVRRWLATPRPNYRLERPRR